MPVMDGITATQQIRQMIGQLQSDVPIIGMTANALKDDRERWLSAGMNDYISKLVSLRSLDDVLKRWVKSENESLQNR